MIEPHGSAIGKAGAYRPSVTVDRDHAKRLVRQRRRIEIAPSATRSAAVTKTAAFTDPVIQSVEMMTTAINATPAPITGRPLSKRPAPWFSWQ